MTTISNVMTTGVRTLRPEDSAQLAAQAMSELNIGSVPICDGDRLVGMLTDRDLAVRGMAEGRDGQTPIGELMSGDVLCCHVDDAIDRVAMTMEEAQVRRIPVIDDDRRLVGIVALGDLAVRGDAEAAGQVLGDISMPSEPVRSHQSQASGPAGGGGTSPGR